MQTSNIKELNLEHLKLLKQKWKEESDIDFHLAPDSLNADEQGEFAKYVKEAHESFVEYEKICENIADLEDIIKQKYTFFTKLSDLVDLERKLSDDYDSVQDLFDHLAFIKEKFYKSSCTTLINEFNEYKNIDAKNQKIQDLNVLRDTIEFNQLKELIKQKECNKFFGEFKSLTNQPILREQTYVAVGKMNVDTEYGLQNLQELSNNFNEFTSLESHFKTHNHHFTSIACHLKMGYLRQKSEEIQKPIMFFYPSIGYLDGTLKQFKHCDILVFYKGQIFNLIDYDKNFNQFLRTLNVNVFNKYLKKYEQSNLGGDITEDESYKYLSPQGDRQNCVPFGLVYHRDFILNIKSYLKFGSNVIAPAPLLIYSQSTAYNLFWKAFMNGDKSFTYQKNSKIEIYELPFTINDFIEEIFVIDNLTGECLTIKDINGRVLTKEELIACRDKWLADFEALNFDKSGKKIGLIEKANEDFIAQAQEYKLTLEMRKEMKSKLKIDLSNLVPEESKIESGESTPDTAKCVREKNTNSATHHSTFP